MDPTETLTDQQLPSLGYCDCDCELLFLPFETIDHPYTPSLQASSEWSSPYFVWYGRLEELWYGTMSTKGRF